MHLEEEEREEEERLGRKIESSRVNFEECILNDKKRKEELQECRGVRQWRTRVDKESEDMKVISRMVSSRW